MNIPIAKVRLLVLVVQLEHLVISEEITTRLVQRSVGDASVYGMVEIKDGNEWSGITYSGMGNQHNNGHHYNNINAKVICRSIGARTSNVNIGQIDPGTINIKYNLNCQGNEPNAISCSKQSMRATLVGRLLLYIVWMDVKQKNIFRRTRSL